MRENEKEFNKYNVKIVIVTFESRYFAHKYINETSFNWPLFVDETRELYAAYGMFSASFWDIWGPKTWWAYCKEILKGHQLKKTNGDIYQRGGDVLIDPKGIVRLCHVGEGPADRPSVDTIFQILKL
ncbi:MAG: AhpC/TSA family protein [Desulfobulbaceae bacterium]|nr:AhpC/TSA family protein [Desulfobulbaceae bacterium]